MSGPASRVPKRWRPTLAVQLSAGLHGAAACALAFNPGWWPMLAATVAGNHLVLGAAGMWPRSQMIGRTLHRLPKASHAVALTFDDGPDPAVTPAVLDMLAAAGARASFFCIGERAAAEPGLLRRMVAAGHSVENHTMTHPAAFAALPPRRLRQEVEGAQATIAGITGRAPHWFRSPMGLRSPLLDPVLTRAGLHQAAWSRRGYDTRCDTADRVLSRLTTRLAPGDILLLHDGNAALRQDRAVVLDVLGRLLRVLAENGLAAVPMPASPSGAEWPAPAAAPESRASA